MKIRHRVPAAAFRTDPVTPEYQAEVDRSTSKAQVAYERAERKLAAATRRLEQAGEIVLAANARGRKPNRDQLREVRIATELVELRREELLVLERLMKSSGVGGNQNRGRGMHRPIPAIASPL